MRSKPMILAALLLTFGSLSDRFGRKGMLLAGLAVVGAASVAAAVPASRNPDAAAPDILGLVLSSATMALLVYTIIQAPAYGWTAPRSLTGFAGSVVLLAAFVVRERRAEHPMLDVRIFRDMRFSAASGAVTVSFFTLLGFIFLITQYFQFVRDYGPLSTGVRLLPVALSVGIGSVAGTQLAVRVGTKLIVTIGLGGTLGVAVIGSVYASVYGSRLAATLPAAVPSQVAAIAHQSVGAAYTAVTAVRFAAFRPGGFHDYGLSTALSRVTTRVLSHISGWQRRA